MKKKSVKKEKYAQKLKETINVLLRSSFSDPRLQFVSVTKVELNADMGYAKVYWDTFDSTKYEEVKEAMSSISSRVRSMLAKTLNVRHVPLIAFYFDSRYESEKSITELLKSSETIDNIS